MFHENEYTFYQSGHAGIPHWKRSGIPPITFKDTLAAKTTLLPLPFIYQYLY